MKIYVGNLNFDTTEEALQGLFTQHGTVEEVHVVTDRQTGRPRGFAFVTMPNSEEAQAAIAALNGTDLDGRSLNVNEARPKREGGGGNRDDRSGGGRSGGRSGGGRRW